MYKIIFDNDNSKSYAGNTFVCNRQRFAEFNKSNPKLYKSKTIAENTAENILANCVNVGNNFNVVEVRNEI